MGSLAAYGRAVALMAEFLPLGHPPAIEMARRRTLQVGARLEQQILATKPLAPPPSAQSIVVSVDGGQTCDSARWKYKIFHLWPCANVADGSCATCRRSSNSCAAHWSRHTSAVIGRTATASMDQDMARSGI